MRARRWCPIAVALLACSGGQPAADTTRVSATRSARFFASPPGGRTVADLSASLKATTDSLVRAAAIPDTVVVTDTIVITIHDSLPTPPDTTKPPTTPPDTAKFAGAAELPRVRVPVPPIPAPRRTLTVAKGFNLQAALDSAQRGDEIVLEAGAVWMGSFRIPAKPGTGTITVRSSEANALPVGVRVGPGDNAHMPAIVSRNSLPALYTVNNASGWRFVGLEVRGEGAAIVNNGLVLLGAGDATQTVLATIPTNIILERSYIHVAIGSSTKRCVAYNAGAVAIVDSYISNCVFPAPGQDAQAIGGWNCSGPLKVTNNYLEGSGENLMLGGADPAITNLVCADIEITGNTFYKPRAWGAKYVVKNLLELKNARRVLIEGNLFRNHWIQAQAGAAIVIGSVNQSGKCDSCIVESVAFRWNWIDSIPGAFNIFEGYAGAQWARRITLDQVLITNAGLGGNGRLFQILNHVHDLTVSNTTGFGATWLELGSDKPVAAHDRMTFRDNIGGATYVLRSDGPSGAAALAAFGGTTYAFTGNVLFGAVTGTLPAGNTVLAASARPTCVDARYRAIGPCKGRGADVDALAKKLGLTIP